MTSIHRPEVSPNESVFDVQGHMRILQKSYMPKNHQDQFESIMQKYQGRLGRKVNNTLVFRKALEAAQKEENSSQKRSSPQKTAMSDQLTPSKVGKRN